VSPRDDALISNVMGNGEDGAASGKGGSATIYCRF
jgi:hypothetical protein